MMVCFHYSIYLQLLIVLLCCGCNSNDEPSAFYPTDSLLVAQSKMNLNAHNSLYSPLFVAHRGLRIYGPENSIPAFIGAGEKGLWGIETDLRITKDSIVVCMHDETIDRTTNGKGKVSDLTYRQLMSYTLKNPSNSSTYYNYNDFLKEDLHIPTLEEYLDICVKYSCIPFIELKEDHGIIDKVIEAISRHHLNGKCYLLSFNMTLLNRVRAKGCKEYIHINRSSTKVIDHLISLGNASISFNISDYDSDITGQQDYKDHHPTTPKELLEMCHQLGLKSTLKGTNERRKAVKAIEYGSDFIVTDYLYSLSK